MSRGWKTAAHNWGETVLFVTKCLSYILASRTLADLPRAKKVVGYSKGTQDMNPHLTISASKPVHSCKVYIYIYIYFFFFKKKTSWDTLTSTGLETR